MTDTNYRRAQSFPPDGQTGTDVDIKMIYRGVSYVSINLPADPEPAAG